MFLRFGVVEWDVVVVGGGWWCFCGGDFFLVEVVVVFVGGVFESEGCVIFVGRYEFVVFVDYVVF